MKYTNTDNVTISSNNSVNEMQNNNNTNTEINTSITNHVAVVTGTTVIQQQQHQYTTPNTHNNNISTDATLAAIAAKTKSTTTTFTHSKNVDPIAVDATTNNNNNNISNNSNISNNNSHNNNTATTLFCEQVTTVTNLFEKWNDCERTVVMYALLKRLRYPTLRFLQYSIDNNLTQNMGTQSNLSTVVVDINANNPTYLQNLLIAYKNFQPSDVLDGMSSSSSDKDSMPCYGSDFQITTSAQCDERKLYVRKEDILHEVLNMLPLLKPGNEEAKANYMSLIPVAVKDTIQQIVSTELVQQIFSYLLIHPAVSGEDRRSLNVWLRHLEDHIQATASGLTNQSYFLHPTAHLGATMTTSSSSSSAASCSSNSNVSMASSSLGNLVGLPQTSCSSSTSTSRDWQTIAPPSKQQYLFTNVQQHKLRDWSNVVVATSNTTQSPGGTSNNNNNSHNSSINALCDNLNGITLNELASSQNSLGLSIGGATSLADNSLLVNGVATAGACALFGNGSNSMMGLIAGSGTNNSVNNLNADDHDNSFSKNGTEILDFEPNNGLGLNDQQQQLAYAAILIGDQFGEINRWSLDSKIAALKTRRSNSLTTQTISSTSSSSNSSVITVNDNCSNSTENLAQYANKPRSFSLSIEHQRGTLTNSGSDTRLDEYKPSYIKFQTRNVGMSGIGLWLKSLRLHKYIELFKNMTYEDMLQITEEFLQSVGVTKGASHKLALCIEKLKDRAAILIKMEKDFHTGQIKLSTAVEELTNIVLTPMKPIEAIAPNSCEENIALRFLKVVDLLSAALQKDPYGDDETLGVFMWILDRSIHNEAFVNHANQLKELKFKLSKLRISIVPKMHHVKGNGGGSSGGGGSANGCGNGNINKPRWSGKNRKSENKNGSNDRINHRKNSNDLLSFSACMPSGAHLHPQQQQQQYAAEPLIYNGYGNQHHQYKSSSYPNFISNQQHQQMKHHQQQQQQQQHSQNAQQLQHMLQQQQHFPTLSQQQISQQQQQQQQQQHHRRSLNNLIVVSGGPQQAQKMIFKSGQGMLSANDNLALDVTATTSASTQARVAQRKPSINGLNNGNSNLVIDSNLQQQQQKKTMAAVVMVSNNKDDTIATTPQILINNNNNMLNNNIINQQQLQLLAAAVVGNNLQAVAAANSNCCIGTGGVGDSSNSISNNINNNNNNNDSNHCMHVQNCSNCCSNNSNTNHHHHHQLHHHHHHHSCIVPLQHNSAEVQLHTNHQLIANMNMSSSSSSTSLKDKYQQPMSAALHAMNDYKSLEQLETLCLQMTEQAIN